MADQRLQEGLRVYAGVGGARLPGSQRLLASSSISEESNRDTEKKKNPKKQFPPLEALTEPNTCPSLSPYPSISSL